MAKSPRESFVGRWYGEEPEPGGITRRWVVDAFPDGVFRITFRFYDADGSYREQVEVGEWGISGPVYFLSTKGWVDDGTFLKADTRNRSEEHTSELQSLMRISYAVFCLYKNTL